MAGFLSDLTLNCNIPFLVSGCMQLIRGLLDFVLVFIRRHKIHKEQKANMTASNTSLSSPDC